MIRFINSRDWLIRKGSLILIQGILFVPGLFAATVPFLEKMHPQGAQQGIAITLTFAGTNLGEELQVFSPLPAAFTPLTDPKTSEFGQDMETAAFLVEVHEEAPVGLYPIRVHSELGLSNVLLFSVGGFPEVMEDDGKENNLPGQGQKVSVPVTVNGTLEGADLDVYRFQAKEGERLVFEVEARRAGSALDPVLRILDSQGLQVARNDDSPGVGVDSRLDLSLPSGEYDVVVNDAKFSRQENNFYRLKIGNFSYANGLFPLGWQRGQKIQIQLLGGSLTSPQELPVDLSTTDEDFVMVKVAGSSGALPLPFKVSDLPETLEPKGQGVVPLKPSTVVNGRIAVPGEVDRYRLTVLPGERWSVELTGSQLGTTRLFGRVTVLDPRGTRLASGGDDIPRNNDFGRQHGATSRDPYINFQVPPGIQEVMINVEDLVGRGGQDYAYRLSAWKSSADFTVSLRTPYINVFQNSTAWVEVQIHRRGYSGPVHLDIPDIGDGVVVEGGDVPREVDSPDTRSRSVAGILTVTAKPEATPGIRQISVRAIAILPDGTKIQRWASGPGLITNIRLGTGFPEPSMRMTELAFTAPWLNLGLPLNIIGSKAAVRLEVEGKQSVRLLRGMDREVVWRLVSPESGANITSKIKANTQVTREVRIRSAQRQEKGEPGTGVMNVTTTMGTVHGKFNLLLEGEVEIQDQKQPIKARAVTFDVVQGYHIIVEDQELVLQPGGQSQLLGRVQRDSLFDRMVTIQPENFPKGVLCESVQVNREQEHFQIPCKADVSVQPGEYDMELTSSSTLATPGKEKVPYRIPPVGARLIVSIERELEARR